MDAATSRLLSLRVGDLMAPNCLKLAPHQTMSEVAELLAQHQISGAPVVQHGRCVGVLSTSDFVRQATTAPLTPTPGTVADYMTRGVQSISAETSLLDAARMMCDHHVHRVVVHGPQDECVGVVSALDLVASITQAFDEDSHLQDFNESGYDGMVAVAQQPAAVQTALPQTDNLAVLERVKILEVLDREGGNKTATARHLGVTRRSLYRLLDKYELR